MPSYAVRFGLLLVAGVRLEGAAGTCTDITGWADSGGDTCANYELNGNWCVWYGDGFANGGHTANTACCACGGGVMSSCCDTVSVLLSGDALSAWSSLGSGRAVGECKPSERVG